MSRTRVLTILSAALTVGGAVVGGAVPLQAQQFDSATARGEQLEDQNQLPAAAAAYRAAIAGRGADVHYPLAALLGLERVYAELGQTDSLLPIVGAAVARLPRSATLREIQMRSLRALGREDAVRAAYEAWRREAPDDPSSYRVYAHMLLQVRDVAGADSVLRSAQRALGSTRAVASELAQLRAAAGLWEPAARAWRVALLDHAYLDDAAAFSLSAAPAEARSAVARVLGAAPPAVGPRAALAALEIEWGDAAAGWAALRDLPPGSAAFRAWLDFAGRAENATEWLPAREALVAAARVQPSPALAARAASDALAGGDAAGAVALASSAERGSDPATVARTVLPVHLRALGALGQPAAAARLLATFRPHVDSAARASLARLVAFAWVRAGELDSARALVGRAGGGDSATAGWIALYGGDLARARRELPASGHPSAARLAALAFLARTTAARSAAAGSAFLALARGDSAQAATAFDSAADELPDAAPLLLLAAARLDAGDGAMSRAEVRWQRIVARYPDAPEAPEAELDWGRALRRAGQMQAAISHLEHLILTHPESALVPQARRELELARGAVPPPA